MPSFDWVGSNVLYPGCLDCFEHYTCIYHREREQIHRDRERLAEQHVKAKYKAASCDHKAGYKKD